MPEENVIIQVLETVPAKRVLAILAHHLSTAFVAFDINPTNRALLNGGFCVCPKEGPVLCRQDNRLTISTGDFCMPSILATGAEFQVTRRTLHQYGLSRVT